MKQTEMRSNYMECCGLKIKPVVSFDKFNPGSPIVVSWSCKKCGTCYNYMAGTVDSNLARSREANCASLEEAQKQSTPSTNKESSAMALWIEAAAAWYKPMNMHQWFQANYARIIKVAMGE